MIAISSNGTRLESGDSDNLVNTKERDDGEESRSVEMHGEEDWEDEKKIWGLFDGFIFDFNLADNSAEGTYRSTASRCDMANQQPRGEDFADPVKCITV